jgi:hypothetical protein
MDDVQEIALQFFFAAESHAGIVPLPAAASQAPSNSESSAPGAELSELLVSLTKGIETD